MMTLSLSGEYSFLKIAIAGTLFLCLSCEKDNSPLGPKEDEVVVGVILPQSGSLASFGPSWLKGIDLAVQHVNDTGGILGRTLRRAGYGCRVVEYGLSDSGSG